MAWQGLVSTIARIRERANTFLESELRRRSLPGILPAHGPVLVVLSREARPMTFSEIVEKVDRVKSTVSGIVDTLEKHGYIRRERSLDDGRVFMISLTDQGRAVMMDFWDISASLQEHLFAGMAIEERAELARLLETVDDNLRRGDQSWG